MYINDQRGLLLKKSRISWIDTAKGICILLVVFQHTSIFTQIDYLFKQDFLTFRMPLYFILSGLFFKTYEGFFGFCKRKFNKLVIPYIFFFSFGGVVLPILLSRFFSIRIWSYSDYGFEAFRLIFNEKYICNPSIWFLFCLFLTNIYFYGIAELSKYILRSFDNTKIIIFLSLFCGFLGLFLYYFRINFPYFLDSALSAIPFFCFGWYLRNKSNFLYLKNTPKSIFLSIIFICISMILIHYTNNVSFSIRNNQYGGRLSMLEFYPYGIIGTLCVLSLSRILGKVPVISYLGRYSIIVLCTHVYMIQLASFISSFFIDDSLIIVFLFAIILNLAIIPLFKNYLGSFTAQKDLIK